jgi:hypothetical protein
MNQEELRRELARYEYWEDKSPAQIISDVISVGGWKSVFPAGVNQWAHRFRNYFNEEPITLTRLKQREARNYFLQVFGIVIINGRQKDFGTFALKDNFALSEALSGDVYRDQNNRIWFQMSPGGTIYHWGGPVEREIREAAYQSYIAGQALTPVFKLISLDETGGSQETIIKNPFNEEVKNIPVAKKLKVGRSNIGKVGRPELVPHLIEMKPEYEGSYNYSETIDSGINAHQKRDVHTHHKDPVYWNPQGRLIPLAERRFPKLSEARIKAYSALL